MSRPEPATGETPPPPLGSWARLYTAVVIVTLAYLGAIALFSSWTF